MTPAASGSAPRQSPSQAKAAPGPGGEALVARIGNMPLLPINAFTVDLPHVKLLGKAEWHNPGESVKDRAAAPGFPVTLCGPENVSRERNEFYRHTAQISSTEELGFKVSRYERHEAFFVTLKL
jgi:hypothetical protein